MTARVPFNIIDQWIVHLDQEPEPWSVHCEVRVPGRLDGERLAAAAWVATQRHPMARARRARYCRRERRYAWEIPDVVDHLPLEILDCPDEEALAAARERIASMRMSLDASPPFALTLAHRPGGDTLIMSSHHAAADGIGAYRLMTSIARAYAGAEDPVPDLDPLAVRDLRRRAGAHSLRAGLRRARLVRDQIAEARAYGAPARIVPWGADANATGYGFHLLRIGRSETEEILGRRRRPATVNDLLLAALAIAIAHQGDLASERISVMMPVSLRPEAWSEEVVANILTFVSVSVLAGDRADLTTAQRAVEERTRTLKERSLSGTMIDIAGLSGFWPLGLRHFLARTLRGRVGSAVADTVLLSDLGRLDPPPDFGAEAGATCELWFSPPAQMPVGVGIGAATVNDEMFLTLRYCHRQFDADGAAALARCWRSILLSG